MLLPLNAFSFVHSHIGTVVRTARADRGVELGCLVKQGQPGQFKSRRKKTKANKLQKPKHIFCKLWLVNKALEPHLHSFLHRMEIPSYAGQSVLTDRTRRQVHNCRFTTLLFGWETPFSPGTPLGLWCKCNMFFFPNVFFIRATIVKLLYPLLTACLKQGYIALNTAKV